VFDTSLSGKILNKSSIFLEAPVRPVNKSDIISAPRVGIKQAVELPWRFYISGNPYVSKP
ncbi:MAG TPA: DNA-3-methyladenine glycosylase, partial [Candidatus Saccharimonadales bacterium]|nr:DNA-3-methyladenine glycosylase [Candidatus Saccharimonadales bacterium]